MSVACVAYFLLAWYTNHCMLGAPNGLCSIIL